MSFTLFRKQIGQQGILPGELLMESTDDLIAITTAGYLTSADGVQPTDVITCVYGTPMVNKQTFNPLFVNGIITLEIIGGGGSINGVTNLGSGNGVLGVAGDNITGKSLVAGANITLTPTANDITIAATGSGGGTITGIVDIGVGEGHISGGTAGTNVQVKSLKAGTNTVITEDSNTVTIASTAGNNGLTTLANLPGGEGIFAGLSGTIAQLKSIAGGAGIDITASGNTVIITNTGGGGGGGFEYDNTQWVAKNGNDANDGKTIDTPKLTVQAAITALAGNGVINIEDNGAYGGAWSIPGGFDITINAPAAFLNTGGVTLTNGCIFKVNAYSFGTNFANMFPAAGNFGTVYLNVQKLRGNVGNGTNNPVQLFIDAQEITGDYLIGANATVIIKFESLAGDIIDTSPGAVSGASILVIGKNQTGNITSTNTKIAGYLVFSSGSPTISGIYQGYFNGKYYGTTFAVNQLNGQPYNVVTWSTAQTNLLDASNYEDYSNAYINYTGSNGYGRFDLTNDAAVPVGFKCWMFQNVNDNQTGVLSSGIGGIANIVSPSTVPGVAYTRRNGSWILLTKVRQNAGVATFNVSGDLWQSNLLSTPSNTYVSMISGDDATGQLYSIDAPYKTIGAAYVALAATFPSRKVNIVILDAEVYFEELTFDNGNINLIGPQASVASSAGDAITVTFSGDQIQINLKMLYDTFAGGKALNITGTNQIILNVDILLQGDLVQGGGGVLHIQSDSINTPLSCTSTGTIHYETAEFTTSISPGAGTIEGISESGSAGSFGSGGTITASTGISSLTGDIQATTGNIRAGSDANPGYLLAYPNTTNSGALLIQPTDNTANVFTSLTNQAASIAMTHKLPKLAFADVTLLATTVSQTDPNSNLIYFDTTITAADLAGGASVTLVGTYFAGQYRVRELYLNINGTNFTGGDRLLNITDGTNIYSVIPAAALLTLSNSRWGDANLPAPVVAGWNTLTQPGVNLSAVYNAGTTDYLTGSVTISGVWEKVL